MDADESKKLEQAFQLLEVEPGEAVERAWALAQTTHNPRHVAGVRHMLFRALEESLFRRHASISRSVAQPIVELLRTDPWAAGTAAAAAVRRTEDEDAAELLFQALGLLRVDDLVPAY